MKTKRYKGEKRKGIVLWKTVSLLLLIASILCMWYYFFVDDDETMIETLQIFHLNIRQSYELGAMFGVLLTGASVGSYFGFGAIKYKEDNILDNIIKIIGIIDLVVFSLNALLLLALILIVSLGLGVVKPIVTTVFRIVGSIYHNQVLFPIVAVSFCCGFVFFVLLQILMRFTNYYRHIATYRIVSLVSFFILLIALLVGFGMGIFKVFTVEEEDLFLGVIWLVLTVMIVLVVLEGKSMFKDFYFLIYDRSRYVLYLRSFSFDNKEDTIAKNLGQLKLPVMKIGNPRTFFPKGIGETYYLPSVNWKGQLDYYISRAQYVFVAVDNTEGVLWEMFEHLEYINKFIYYVEDRSKLEAMLKNNKNQRLQSSILMECFKKTLEKTKNKTFCFRVISSKCFYSNVQNILTSINKTKLDGLVPSFPVESPQPMLGPENDKERMFKDKDQFRARSRGVKKRIKTIYNAVINGAVSILTIAIYLIILAVGLGGVATGIYLIFDDFIPGIDRWPVVIVSIVIGVKCLKSFVKIISEWRNRKKRHRKFKKRVSWR